jgi:hypothetical protein
LVNWIEGDEAEESPLNTSNICEPMVVVPVDRWTKITEKALRFAMSLSKEVKAVHVDFDETDDELIENWKRLIEDPLRSKDMPAPELVRLKSPYRYVINPIVDYVLELNKHNPDREVAVIVPELVEHKWYHYFLHNQRAYSLKALLLLKGNQRIITMNVPWYLTK